MIGVSYDNPNLILFVDSSDGEVNRPNITKVDLKGVSDNDDILKFNYIFENGSSEYINFFKELTNSIIINQ